MSGNSKAREQQLFDAKMGRRAALRRAFYTTLGGAYAFHELGLGPTVQSLFNRLMLQTAGQSLDARRLMAEALQGGPSLFRWSAARALAQETSEQPLSVVTIKVVNHVSTNLVFRLGQPGDNGTTVNGSDSTDIAIEESGVNLQPNLFRKFAFEEGARRLEGLGIGRLSSTPLGLTGADEMETYGSKFRMNAWFASLLHDPANASNAASAIYRSSGLIDATKNAAFDHSKVGLQCALGLEQTRGGNHSLKNLKLRANLPDLSYYVHDKQLISSPLGISAFMMGDTYDKAEGEQAQNVVIKSYSDSEAAAVDGVSVTQHAESIIQSVESAGSGYADQRGADGLTQKFDQLVASEPKLRRAMEASKEQFAAEVSSLTSLADLERRSAHTDVDLAKIDGCLQTIGVGSPPSTGADLSRAEPAKSEFLAQVQYTSQLLGLEGRPVRNFSLFLNMQDVDANNIDTPAFGGPAGRTRCLTYIEGMRQLAIGMNTLAKVIAEQGNVVVVVVSEGGRSNTMSDSKSSFGFVMGPKSAGYGTKLHADLEAISKADSPQVLDPGLEVAAHMQAGTSLRTSGNQPSAGAAKVGDFQAGAVRAIAEQLNNGISLVELGQFVRVREG